MVENTFKLGRIAGIEIGIHYTWLFGFVLLAWSLAAGFFPANFPGWGPATYWIIGILAALALFLSVLIHELSHSFVARARGQGVHSITLFLFGGISNLEADSRNAKDEFLVSVVGPLTSFVLAVAFWALLRAAGPANRPLAATLVYLVFVNALLGAFNLLPGFPLDGGRVLRSIIWAFTGNGRKATEIASYAGQGFGFLLIFLGLWQLLAGDVLGGLWTAFIGWFLSSAAESARLQLLAQGLGSLPVQTLMSREPRLGSPAMSVQDFVLNDVLRRGNATLLLTDDGRLAGIVSAADLKDLPQEAWAITPLRAIMTPIPLQAVSPDVDLKRAVQLLVEGPFNQLPVVEDGRVVGVLTPADVLGLFQLRGEPRDQPSPRRSMRSAAA